MNRFARMRGDATKYGKRHVPGQMNRTEAEYAALLESRKRAGTIIEWKFESFTVRLADKCRYTPDFWIWLADNTLEFVDTKIFKVIDPKSLVKAKVAAEQYPGFRFVIEEKMPKKLGGGWRRTEF